MTSLSDKLRRLGVRVGTRAPASRPRPAYPIEHIVPGRVQQTGSGDAFVVETRYPLDQRHGCATLSTLAPLHVLSEWANEPTLERDGAATLVFLDIETTGLGLGTGTYAFLVGVGRSDGDTFHLAQFFLRDPGQEPALLDALVEWLRDCRALVTFNGKGFDVPLLNTRYITNGRRSPLPSLAHLDLLPLARRLWRDRLPSRALGSLEHYILGVTRNEEDVPGWMIPQLYIDYVRSGDARPLKSAFYHNAQDVLTMAALLSHVAGMLQDPLGNRSIHALDLLGMGRLFESLGRTQVAVDLYGRALGGSLPAELRQRAVQRLSFIQKRGGAWETATALWREAAQGGAVYACVELAKYYEHQQKDYQEAARWTLAAIAQVDAPGYPHPARQRWLADLHHRLARLRRRGQVQEPPP
jgi:uncharacterized protein YprB with RNaseH-like and TPR domain